MKYWRSTHHLNDWWTEHQLCLQTDSEVREAITGNDLVNQSPPTSVFLCVFLFNLPIYLPFQLCSHHNGDL